MLALTVRQPWAHAIIYLGKDVENRTWSTEHRGPLAIHAGKKLDHDGSKFLSRLGFYPTDDELVLGAAIGIVDLVDCVPSYATAERPQSVWAVDGQYHWVLANPRALSIPVRCRGYQGLFEVTLRF